MSADLRLIELGIELPEPARPAFAPRLRSLQVHGGLGYLSGNGVFDVVGRVGEDVTVEQAQDAAARTALQLFRVLQDELGSLDAVDRWVKVLGFIRSAPGFAEQPAVLERLHQPGRRGLRRGARPLRAQCDRGLGAAGRDRGRG